MIHGEPMKSPTRCGSNSLSWGNGDSASHVSNFVIVSRFSIQLMIFGACLMRKHLDAVACSLPGVLAGSNSFCLCTHLPPLTLRLSHADRQLPIQHWRWDKNLVLLRWLRRSIAEALRVHFELVVKRGTCTACVLEVLEGCHVRHLSYHIFT